MTSCCSTTCCGSNGRSTSTTSSSRGCASAASRCSCPDLLAEALAASDEARRRLIELVASEYTVGWSLVDEIRASWRTHPESAGDAPDRRADRRRGRRSTSAAAKVSLIGAALDDTSAFVLPPLPNTLFTRDSSCWIYDGVSINPMYWPARRREAYNMAAIYRAHPDVRRRGLRVLVPAGGPRRAVRDPPTSDAPRSRAAT